MCAINGIIDIQKKYSNSELRDALNAMNLKVVHRGPDDEGIFVENHIGIGMRRLAIIDLEGGHQPIFNESKDIAIVCNGEIYNHKELRHRLETEGHIFLSHSDAEVVVHAYEEYGTDCFSKLDGMFAIAIYDTTEQKIILARDKAGEKPLYWYKNDLFFCFASELKSITQMEGVVKEISPEGLHQYFTLTYIPAPLTIFKNIYKLKAASFMVVEADGTVLCSPYWDMVYDDSQLISDYDTCKQKLREALFQSVESRLMSDVPLGTFMSGGIDSTLITGVATRILGKPIDTFTIGFEYGDYDERDRATIAAKAFGTKAHTDVLTADKVKDIIDTIIDNMDEPFADVSAIPTYFVSNLASDYVKVILTGDGGDELFAGYSKYLIGYYSQKYNTLPSFFRHGIFEPIVHTLPANGTLHRKAMKVINNANKPLYEQRLRLMQLGCNEEMYRELVRPEFHVDIDSIAPIYLKFKGYTDELSQALYTDFKIVLEGDMFVKVDRMSMLNSIETRTPMVAGAMLDLAIKIPSQFKINRNKQKIILKETFEDVLPKSLLKFNKKGFGIPLEHWFRGELKKELQDQLTQCNFIDDILDKEYMQSLLQEHISKKANNAYLLWGLYIFTRWMRKGT